MKRKLIVFLFALGLALPPSYVSAGTVLSSHKYAWSDNVGYINFENVVVSDSLLSGYAWTGNAGWIKFSPAQGGVSNNGSGNLSGSAWGEQLGWIDFNNVSINSSTGGFSGTATGALVGTINFDCPNYCDVETDWRRTETAGGNGSGAALAVSSGPTPTPGIQSHVDTYDEPLTVLPEQSGTFTQDTSAGPVVLEIPADTLSDKTTFHISTEPLTLNNEHLVLGGIRLVNGVFYDIWAKDQDGDPVTSFSPPLTVVLPMPLDLQGLQNLAVYWLNEVNSQWVLIPEATFTDGQATYQVNRLTRFAIFGTEAMAWAEPTESPAPSLPVPAEKGTAVPAASAIGGPDKTMIEKIKVFFEPVIPDFLKPLKVVEPSRVTGATGAGAAGAGATGTAEAARSIGGKPQFWIISTWVISLFALFTVLRVIMHKKK